MAENINDVATAFAIDSNSQIATLQSSYSAMVFKFTLVRTACSVSLIDMGPS